jgi:hypothetical protein
MADDQQAASEVAHPPTLRNVLEPLLAIPDKDRSFAARELLACLSHLEGVQQQLKIRKAPELETLADQEGCAESRLRVVALQ